MWFYLLINYSHLSLEVDKLLFSCSYLIFPERSWLEQGQKIGEHVVPLARNFNSVDIESGSNSTVSTHSNGLVQSLFILSVNFF